MMDKLPKKINLNSLDIAQANKAKLKESFPHIFSETKNDKGEITEALDFEALKAELGIFSEALENRKERYGMSWAGKKESLKVVQTSSKGTLNPSVDNSINFQESENLYIEGDNLEVLKLLQKSYYGKVKLIYIDPPYNTGKEFIYPDKYSESLETYLQYAGLLGKDGKVIQSNTVSEGRFHTKWLNMMYPRLYLARNLLRDDGIIFISIDDNEQTNLRNLCNDIFGEDNFVGTFVWQSKKGGGAKTGTVVKDHEYIICYAKHDPEGSVSKTLVQAEALDKKDDKGLYRLGRELNKWGSNSRRVDRPTMWFPVTGPAGEEIYPIRNDGSEGRWRLGKNKLLEIIKQGNAEFVKREDGTFTVYEKIRDQDPREKPYRTFLTDTGTTADGSKTVKELFGGKNVFDFPKPVDLIKHLLKVGLRDDDDIVLDFFSGSASTAQAVLEYNLDEDKKIQFICVQLPEPLLAESEAKRNGFNTIADIGISRIKLAIKKLEESKPQLELKSNSEVEPSCLNVRYFKLEQSNFKIWDAQNSNDVSSLQKQLEMQVDNLKENSQQENILFEILLKAGFKLSEKIEVKSIAGKRVFSISDGALLVYLEDEITKEVLGEIYKLEPIQFICLDSTFNGNDQLKANAVQMFYGQDNQKSSLTTFRTI